MSVASFLACLPQGVVACAVAMLCCPAAEAQVAEPTASSSTESSAAQVAPPKSFVALFNGQDLEGWRGMGHWDPRKYWELDAEAKAAFDAKNWEDAQRHWRVENGELVNDGAGVYLTTADDYRDFELHLEYKTVPLADSGIYLRGTPQVQIWDTTEAGGKWEYGADKGSGGLWNNQGAGKDPLVHADKPFGQWNQLRIVMRGTRVHVWLNDKLVVDGAVLENYWDRNADVFEKGPIQLQTHGGEIRWRNIFLRDLSAETDAEPTDGVKQLDTQNKIDRPSE
jgi:hypothetical protein